MRASCCTCCPVESLDLHGYNFLTCCHICHSLVFIVYGSFAVMNSCTLYVYLYHLQTLTNALRMWTTVLLVQTVQTPREALSVSVGLASLVMEEPLELVAQVQLQYNTYCHQTLQYCHPYPIYCTHALGTVAMNILTI